MTAHATTMQPTPQPVPAQTVILVIEDDPALRGFLSDLLEGEGYRAHCVESGTQGLQALEALTPDLVLLDLVLPDLDGYTVCRQIRANVQRPIPIVMLSANRDPLDVLEALHVGVDEYLRKPFEVEDLLAQIRAHLPLVLPTLADESPVAVEILDPAAARLDPHFPQAA
ncbi:MAG TPA: response regulator transcription factor [Herpetosiphonaceae bacterium]